MASTGNSEKQPNSNNALVKTISSAKSPLIKRKPTDGPTSLGSLLTPQKRDKVEPNNDPGNSHENATAAQDENESDGEHDEPLADGFYTADAERRQWTEENMETVLQNPKPIPAHLTAIYNQSGLKLAFQRLWTNSEHWSALHKLEKLDEVVRATNLKHQCAEDEHLLDWRSVLANFESAKPILDEFLKDNNAVNANGKPLRQVLQEGCWTFFASMMAQGYPCKDWVPPESPAKMLMDSVTGTDHGNTRKLNDMMELAVSQAALESLPGNIINAYTAAVPHFATLWQDPGDTRSRETIEDINAELMNTDVNQKQLIPLLEMMEMIEKSQALVKARNPQVADLMIPFVSRFAARGISVIPWFTEDIRQIEIPKEFEVSMVPMGGSRNATPTTDVSMDPPAEAAPTDVSMDSPAEAAPTNVPMDPPTELLHKPTGRASSPMQVDDDVKKKQVDSQAVHFCESAEVCDNGLIVGSRSAGRGGKRIFVNRGTEQLRYHVIFNGGDMGNIDLEAIDDAESPSDVRDWKRHQITDVYDRVEVEPTKAKSKRKPITFYLVGFKDYDSMEEYWITRTELICVKGKVAVEEKCRSDRSFDFKGSIDDRMTNGRADVLAKLDACKKAGIHPDTERELDERDAEQYPWLISEEVRFKLPSRKRSTETGNIGKGIADRSLLRQDAASQSTMEEEL